VTTSVAKFEETFTSSSGKGRALTGWRGELPGADRRGVGWHRRPHPEAGRAPWGHLGEAREGLPHGLPRKM